MGFEYTASVYRIGFDDEDGPLHGLEIVVRSAGAEALMAVEELPAYTGQLSPMRPAIEAFTRLLVRWNVTEDGRAVPCTAAEFLLRDEGFVSVVFGRWVRDIREALKGPAEPEVFDESQLEMVPLEAVS